VLDQVRVQLRDLLLGDIDLLQGGGDLLEGQIALVAAQRAEAANFLGVKRALRRNCA
jgi:hypothetical protein